MISRHKTFAVALSRQMVPTARIVVYYLQTSPEELVVDTLNFFVNGTRSNPVSNILGYHSEWIFFTCRLAVKCNAFIMNTDFSFQNYKQVNFGYIFEMQLK